MTTVYLTDYEKMLNEKEPGVGFESMLNRFNRKIQDSGLFKDLKKNEFYEKRSIKRRRKLYEAKIKTNKRERRGAIHKER